MVALSPERHRNPPVHYQLSRVQEEVNLARSYMALSKVVYIYVLIWFCIIWSTMIM